MLDFSNKVAESNSICARASS